MINFLLIKLPLKVNKKLSEFHSFSIHESTVSICPDVYGEG